MSFRAGFIGVVGKPNAGKSTLVNAVVGEKVSIVSSKPQTTRRRIQGIVTTEAYQAIFVDAPGIIQQSTGLNKFLQNEYQDVARSSDALCVVFHIDDPNAEYADELIAWAQSTRKPWFAVITKNDLPQVHRIGILRGKLEAAKVPVIAVSAVKNPEGARELVLEKVAALLPECPAPLYEGDDYTTETVRELCAEIIREKCFDFLHQEIPYGLAVQVRAFEDQGRLVKVHADVIVERENHKAIAIGEGGRTLCLIGTEARKDIEKLLGRKVFLENRVVCKPRWVQNGFLMKELGYVVDR